MLVLAIVIARSLPVLEPRERVGYGALLASVLRTVTSNRTVRITTLIGASAMCVFIMFWTGLTFLLAAPPFSYSATQIGLVSLIGIAGAVSAQRVGRLFDRGLSLPAIAIGLLLALTALVLSGVAASSIVVLFISIALFSIGLQSVQVLVQTRMLSIDRSARSRLNTVIIVGNFIGGAIGSALAGIFWPLGGWPVLTIAAATVTGFALTLWLVHRTRALAG
jgi:predicted MFS family arabinose efflux permease